MNAIIIVGLLAVFITTPVCIALLWVWRYPRKS